MLSSLALAAAPARAECRFGLLAQLPVTMDGSRPLIQAQINGQDQLFLADSGAFFNLMSRSRADALKLTLSPAPFGYRVTGVGGVIDVMLGTARAFTLAGVDFRHQEFVVGGSESDRRGAGVIGRNLLQLRDAEYDLAHGMIRLFDPHGCDRTMLAYWATPQTPVSSVDIRSTYDRAPIVGTAVLDGQKISVLFDTGASTSLLSLEAAARAGVRPGGAGVAEAGVSRGIGRSLVKTWVGPFASFKIGGEEIRTTRLRFGGIDVQDVDMILGADFFLSHRVYVANSQRQLYFTYNGGRVFDLRRRSDDAPGDRAPPDAATAPAIGAGPTGPAPAAASAAPPPMSLSALAAPSEPTDAEGFSRRAAALAARGERDKALTDVSHAMELAPGEARYAEQRASLRLAAHQPMLAMSDLDTVLRLKPDDVEARITRARLRLVEHDGADAKADLDAAAAASDKGLDARLSIAAGYTEADAFDAAVKQYDLWIAAHPDDSRRGQALNGRCWARGLGGLEPARAVGDCNGALQLSPGSANVLDSRGLAFLRKGDLDRAIADYDAALKLNPKIAWSLYGRGVARERKGDKAAGEADIAAAAVIAPKLPERAKRLGITP